MEYSNFGMGRIEMNRKFMDYRRMLEFYTGKKVLITGNTGFKGAWLTHILLSSGAEITGYSLQPPTDPSLFQILKLNEEDKLHQVYGDVRDLSLLRQVFKEAQPEIVFHLAAQPIVRDSYRDPVITYSTNIMGTVNVCECIRTVVREDGQPIVKSFLNVTTDKVYKNNEWEWGYRETDFLDGFDPYSNSKSCSELVTHSYKDAFYSSITDDKGNPIIRVSTARAGNVIGGGDFSNDRIIPDCVRSLVSTMKKGEEVGTVTIRNPYSTRPYEHVLEPLFAYMLIAMAQYEDASYAGYYNVGPDDQDCVNTGDLVTLFCNTWNNISYNCGNFTKENGMPFPSMSWINKAEVNAPHEANFLKLDCSKLKSTFHWQPRWHIDEAIAQTVNWTKIWINTMNESKNGTIDRKLQTLRIKVEMNREIEEFIGV